MSQAPGPFEAVHGSCHRKEPVLFGSVRFRTFNKYSVWFSSAIHFSGSMRFGLRFSDASWLGPVRFGTVPRPVPTGSGIHRFGSIRFGSVRFGFLFPPAVRQCAIDVWRQRRTWHLHPYTALCFNPGFARPISLIILSLLRFVDSRFPGNSLWT